mmetsp:Transcript_7943/g.19866  ORF Transcript_7943/g.19866 Transcript_7943/m.19866 type:complete len:322 (-) Transcript_7943:3444-4409(-)
MKFGPGDVITAQITKADVKQPPGIKFEIRHGRIYVRKLEGIWKQRSLPVEVGDQLLQIFDTDVQEFGRNGAQRLAAIKSKLKTERTIDVQVLRLDPNASDDSTDSEDEQDDGQKGYYEESEEYEYDPRSNDQYEEEEEDQYDRGYEYDDEVEEEDDYFDPNSEPVVIDEIRPGSTMKLRGMTSKKRLNGEHVKVLPNSSGKDEFDVELPDGSRLSVRSELLSSLEEGEEPTPFWNEDDTAAATVGSKSTDAASSTRSFAPNLIEAGDMMKIRGLKKKAKMNGTPVEVLGPAEQPGRWEVLIVDDPDERVISIAASNLRHIM